MDDTFEFNVSEGINVKDKNLVTLANIDNLKEMKNLHIAKFNDINSGIDNEIMILNKDFKNFVIAFSMDPSYSIDNYDYFVLKDEYSNIEIPDGFITFRNKNNDIVLVFDIDYVDNNNFITFLKNSNNYELKKFIEKYEEYEGESDDEESE